MRSGETPIAAMVHSVTKTMNANLDAAVHLCHLHTIVVFLFSVNTAQGEILRAEDLKDSHNKTISCAMNLNMNPIRNNNKI